MKFVFDMVLASVLLFMLFKLLDAILLKAWLPAQVIAEGDRTWFSISRLSCFPPVILLFNRLDALPSAAQLLLPQTNPVVPGAHSKNVAAQTPAHAPCNRLDVEDCGLPFTCS